MQMSIFSKDYWLAACREFTDLKRLLLAAVLCALTVVLEKLEIQVVEGLQVQFTFLTLAICGAICGPLLGMAVAGTADTLYSLLLSPYGYFPGYLLNKLLIGLIFGLLLYRRKITLPRLFFGKLLVNYPINLLLGSLWMHCITGKGYLIYFWPSAVKNTVLLPLEVMLLAALFAALLPAAAKRGLLPGHDPEELKKLRFRESAFPILSAFSLCLGLFGIAYTLLWKGHWVFGLLGGLFISGAIALWIIDRRLKKNRE